MPNSRQWALLFWVVVLTGWALSRRDVRTSVVEIMRTARNPKLLVPFGGMLVWITLEVWAGAQVGRWNSTLSADTALWFVTAGLVLYGSFTDVSKHRRFFRRQTGAALGLSTLAEGYTELAVFSLPVELLIQPIVTLIVCVGVVAEMKQEHRPAKRVTDGCLTIFGLWVLMFVTTRLIATWGELDKDGLLFQLALPVWMTIGLLPYVYLVGLIASYEVAFLHADWKSNVSWGARWRTRLVLLTSFHIRAADVGGFAGVWPRRLAEAGSFRQARQVIRDFRTARGDEARTKAAAEATEHLADVDGEEAEGHWLD